MKLKRDSMADTLTSKQLKIIRISFLLIAVYALAGFFMAPALLKHQLNQKPGQTAQAIDFNPFSLTLEIQGFSLEDTQSKPIAAWDKLVLDIHGIESIRKMSWVASIQVSKPKFDVELDSKGQSNFAFLSPAQDKPSSSGPAFLLKQLVIEQGDLSFKDRAKNFEMSWTPIDLNLENLSNQPGETAHFKLNAANQIEFQGLLNLTPLNLEASVKLSKIALPPLSAYLNKPYRIKEGELDLSLNGHLGPDKQFEIQSENVEFKHLKLEKDSIPMIDAKYIKLESIAFQSRKIALKTLHAQEVYIKETTQEKPRFTLLKDLTIKDISASIGDSSLNIGSFNLKKSKLSAWIKPTGDFALPGMPEKQGQAAESESKPWKIAIRALKLDDFSLAIDDETKTPLAQTVFESATLKLDDFSLQDPFKIKLAAKLGNGQIESSGQIGLNPLSADLNVSIGQLNVRRLQAYLERFPQIDLMKGRFNMQGHLNYAANNLRFIGQSNVTDFESEDKSVSDDFVDWKNLKLEGIDIETQPLSLSVDKIVADSPYARLTINQNGKLNLIQNLSPVVSLQASPAKEETPIAIHSIRVLDGRTNFSDLSLKQTFAAEIHNLNGTIHGLSSAANAKANVSFEGRINHDGSVKISGQMNPFKIGAFSDIALQFHNINLTTLSPYSSKFAGYRIEKGKLSMNLNYKLLDDRLSADNNIVLDQLILGERVESADATSLPIRLAIALLKDSSGKIDLDLPISGDLSNPEFSIGSLYGSALKQMLTKLVSSPFSLLGSLIEYGGEDLGAIQFEPGKSALTLDEKTKLSKLVQALKDRPNLNLEIKGVAHGVIDKPVLAMEDLLRHLKNVKLIELSRSREKKSDIDELTLSDEDYRRLLTEFYKNKHPEISDIPKILSDPAFEKAQQQIIESWEIGEIDLRILAQARAESIRAYLVKQAGLTEQRIYMLDVKLSAPEEKQIKATLYLSPA